MATYSPQGTTSNAHEPLRGGTALASHSSFGTCPTGVRRAEIFLQVRQDSIATNYLIAGVPRSTPNAVNQIEIAVERLEELVAMLPFHHDSTALHAVLKSDFGAISRNVTLAPQIEQVAALLMESTLRILRDLLGHWNMSSSVSRLPAELLASCFMFLPFRDRIVASQVSHSWRLASLHHPALWSQIDLSTKFRRPLALLTMALARAGQHPIDLMYKHWGVLAGCNYWTPFGVKDGPLPAVLDVIECILPRVRLLDWDSPAPIILTKPMPRLEALTSRNIWLSDGLAPLGYIAKLRTLHVPLQALPPSTFPLYSVKEFTGIVEGNRSLWSAKMANLFDIFPQVESLTLTGFHMDFVHLMLPGPLPPTLKRFTLIASTADGKDLVEKYIPWQTAQLREVELYFRDWSTADEITGLRAGSLFTSIHELSIGPGKDDSVCITGKGADGRTLVLAFDRAFQWAYVGASAAASLAQAIKWLSVADLHSLFHSVCLPPPLFAAVVDSGIQLPSVRTAVITLEKFRHRARVEFAHPGTLSFVDRLHTCLPALETFVLELHNYDGTKVDHLYEAVKLVRVLEELIAPGLPVLRIRGFSREVAQAIDTRQLQLAMRVEFDIPQD